MKETPKQSLIKKLLIMFAIILSCLFMQTFTTPVHAESYDFDEGDPSSAHAPNDSRESV